jgi:transposase InsO family protein
LVKKTVFTLQPILSTSFKSPNLLKDLTLSHAEQVFVSDITYIKVDGGHYLALVTDAYSKKIMGWN